MSAEVLPFPREGFLINAGHCRAPGAKHHDICLRPIGHDGEHEWSDWRGCYVRVPIGDGVVRFGGFAH